jgi:hypothetical protein
MKNSAGEKAKSSTGQSKMSALGRRLSELRSPVASPAVIAATPKRATPQGVIVNELLCFVINKLDILPHDTIAKLCGDTFSDPEIEDSKAILFNLCAMENDRSRMIKRKGVDKKMKNLNDILNLLHGLEPELIPCFAAADLSKLPPISYNHMDMSVILKELESVKSDIAGLKIAQTDALEIFRNQQGQGQPRHNDDDDGEKMNDNAADPKSSETDEIGCTPRPGSAAIDPSQPDGGQGASVSWKDDGEVPDVVINDPSAAMARTLGDTDVDVTEKEDGELDDSITELKQLLSPSRPAVTQLKPKDVPSFSMMARELSARGLADKQLSAIKTTDDGFTTVSPRRKKPMVIGTGSSTALRGVKSTPRTSTAAAFVTRLSPGTSEAEMCDYVRSKFGIDTRCEQLETRYDTYASFKVVVNAKFVDKLIDPIMWPAGVMVRKFFVAKSSAR